MLAVVVAGSGEGISLLHTVADVSGHRASLDGSSASMQHRYPLDAGEEFLLPQEVDDALAATPHERMQAALTLTREFADFLDVLNSERVRYVGNDVLIDATREKAAATRRAERRWGGFDPEFGVGDSLSSDILSSDSLLRVEVHTQVPGVEWEHYLTLENLNA